MRKILNLIILILLAGSIAAPARVSAQTAPAPALGGDFVSRTAKVKGATLHYVRGGSGPALILIHGFPQDLYEFRHVMPRLAKKFTVVAMDLRGVGGSAVTAAVTAAGTGGKYDAATMAEDVFNLSRQLKLEKPYIVGHDIGGSVAYAFLRQHKNVPRGVMILETPIAGLDPWDDVIRNPKLWHIGFLQTPAMPEELLDGKQAVFIGRFLSAGVADPKAITDADVQHYAASHTKQSQLHAVAEIYRAFPANEKFNKEHRDAIDLPVVLVGGEKSFGPLFPKVAVALREHGCANVTVETIGNAAHYLFEEKPGEAAALIERYAGQGQ